jgi:hypothetical protein
MPNAWSAKRERQYEHIEETELDQGRSTKRAKEIAARTVNKQRAQEGEAKSPTRSSSSRSGSSSGRRGGSTRGDGRTKEQLYAEAKRLDIAGRSKMNKAQLQRAVDRRR